MSSKRTKESAPPPSLDQLLTTQQEDPIEQLLDDKMRGELEKEEEKERAQSESSEEVLQR